MDARQHRALLVVLWTIAAMLLVFVLVGIASPGRRHHAPCTHGVSSVGPVVVAKGRAVGGSTVPHTQACLP